MPSLQWISEKYILFYVRWTFMYTFWRRIYEYLFWENHMIDTRDAQTECPEIGEWRSMSVIRPIDVKASASR